MQVAPSAKNSAAEEFTRSELLRVLGNLQLYQYARFFESEDSTGKQRLKQLKGNLQTPDKIRKASSTAVLKLSSALNGGAGWGLEAYLPSQRLLPGRPLAIIEGHGGDVLSFTSDEGPDMKLSHAFLASVGLRCRYERDFWHRLDNSHCNSVGQTPGYSHVQAKALFLSRVNRTPYGSGANANLKMELLVQFHQVCQTMTSDGLSQMFEAGLKFDTSSCRKAASDNLLSDMMDTAKSIHQRSEGVPCMHWKQL